MGPFQNTKVWLDYLVEYPFLPHASNYHYTQVASPFFVDRNLEQNIRKLRYLFSYKNIAEHVS